MRNTILAVAAVVTAILVPGASHAFWPFDGLGDAVTTLVAPRSGTEGGVTKTRLGSLHPDDHVVTDVDLSQAPGLITNLVAGQGIAIDDVPGGKRISALGQGLDTNAVNAAIEAYDRTNLTVRLSTVKTALVDALSRIVDLRDAVDELEASESADRRDISFLRLDVNNAYLIISNLYDSIPVTAPQSAYAQFYDLTPAVRIVDGDGVGFYVRCTDGTYRDLRDVDESSGPFMAFDLESFYGRTFTRTYLSERLGPSYAWTSDLTPSGENIGQPITSVCGGAGYPPCYGRTATVRELLCDLLVADRSLWLTNSIAGHLDEIIDIKGLASAVNSLRQSVADAQGGTAQLRHDYEGGPAFGHVLTNAVLGVSSEGGAYVWMRPGETAYLDVPTNVTSLGVSFDSALSGRHGSSREVVGRMFIRTTDRVQVNCLQNASLRYVSTRSFTLDAESGYMLTVSRVGHDEHGNKIYCASLERVFHLYDDPKLVTQAEFDQTVQLFRNKTDLAVYAPERETWTWSDAFDSAAPARYTNAPSALLDALNAYGAPKPYLEHPSEAVYIWAINPVHVGDDVYETAELTSGVPASTNLYYHFRRSGTTAPLYRVRTARPSTNDTPVAVANATLAVSEQERAYVDSRFGEIAGKRGLLDEDVYVEQFGLWVAGEGAPSDFTRPQPTVPEPDTRPLHLQWDALDAPWMADLTSEDDVTALFVNAFDSSKSFTATRTKSCVTDTEHKLAKRMANPESGSLAKFDADGNLVVAEKSSSSADPANADYRDPTDNTCHRTEFGEWELTYSDGVDHHFDASTIRYYDGNWHFDDYNAYGDQYDYENATEISTSASFRSDYGYAITATRQRVAAKDEPFVTQSFVTNEVAAAISTNNPAFVSVVREVVDAMGTFRVYDRERDRWYLLKVVDGTMTLEQE